MEWINVKDRLPETSGQYLVYTECGDMFNAEFELDYGEFGNWYECYHPDTLGFLDSEWGAYDGITHWMPLPELPTEKEDAPKKTVGEEYSNDRFSSGWDCSDEEYNYSAYVRDVINAGW